MNEFGKFIPEEAKTFKAPKESEAPEIELQSETGELPPEILESMETEIEYVFYAPEEIQPVPEKNGPGFVERNLNKARVVMAAAGLFAAAETKAFDTEQPREDRVVSIEKNNNTKLGIDLTEPASLGIDLKEKSKDSAPVTQYKNEAVARLEKQFPGLGQKTSFVFDRLLAGFSKESDGIKIQVIQVTEGKLYNKLMGMSESQKKYCVNKNISGGDEAFEMMDRERFEEKRRAGWNDLNELKKDFGRFDENRKRCEHEIGSFSDKNLKSRAKLQESAEHMHLLRAGLELFLRKDVPYKDGIKYLEKTVEPGAELDLSGFQVRTIKRDSSGKIFLDGIEAKIFKANY